MLCTWGQTVGPESEKEDAMAIEVGRLVLGAAGAFALLAGIWVAREAGVGPSRVPTASPAVGIVVSAPSGDCTFDAAGNYLVDQEIIPGYTVTCWDADWNLSVPSPMAHR